MPDYDVIVIGSGFGGSVSALRLTEKGYRVAVLEAGQRFTDDTLPKTSWDTRNFVWAPKLGLKGIQRIHVLKNVVILAGAGVGGGSLNYANTLYEPLQPFYDDPQWSHITDWREELAPFYAQAKKMLGVVTNPTMTRSDVEMKRLADQFGKGDTFHLTPVGVFFGRNGAQEPGVAVPDPFFGGVGPERKGCIQCGSCMTGCRHGAKNTLVKNYLALAEQGGAQIHPLTTVTNVRPVREGGYAVDTVRTGKWTRRPDSTLTATHVVFAAGTWGTQTLLHRLRQTTLPGISPRLGHLTRTNSESLLGVLDKERRDEYTQGVAITSSWHPDPNTHIEPVRYGKGSNAMGLLTTAMTDGGTRRYRWRQWLGVAFRNPKLILGLADPAALVRADHHPAGHAVAEQLDHGVPPQDRPAHVHAGRGRAEPDVDPDGQQGGAATCREHRRRHRRHVGRPHEHPDDCALHRRLPDRRIRADRRHRPVPPHVRLRGPARRRRLDADREPGRQPGPVDHRAGRAGLVHVAESWLG